MKTQILRSALFLIILASTLAAEKPQVQVKELLKTTTTWDGAALPNYPEGQPEVSVLKITIPPQMRLPWHKHPVINTGLLLSGELEVTLEDGRTFQLAPWDAISEVVDAWHYGRNTGNTPAVILVVYSGVVGVPLSIPMEDSEASTDH